MAPSATETVVPQSTTSTAPAAQQPGAPPPAGINVAGYPSLDRDQIMTLLQHIPGVFSQVVTPDGKLKEDAAQTLSNLASQQANFPPPNASQPGASVLPGVPMPQLSAGFPPPGLAETGPNSHPRGPPNLGQLSAVAMQVAPPAPVSHDNADDVGDDDGSDSKEKDSPTTTPAPAATGRRRNNPQMGSDEWTRQRKDNHKEVERRRRSNINEGINELGRIVPNGSGEKSKGAILSRAVQYIHHLKENEARNIEKWTLEKLLMDQAMGDLQAQLEEVRNMWTEERNLRQRAEAELEQFKSGASGPPPAPAAENKANGTKRPHEDNEQGKEEDGKKQRTE
ncbi:putative cbf1-centromere binding factor 1 [Moniliophthora roreri]|uniref:BHLH domain-containing protein n=1 Tax=Moniliophthora roreri TaxID=221103 RepID=A0A0W0FMJ9_MONRR|nr:putative cbf1-centromere binding factor 1 [Moniliophthora roreri]